MAAALFISDLHLDPARPAATATFLRFLRNEALEAERLYILGDLFEAWIGDDDPNPHHREVIAALADYTRHNPRCFFMHGNRDFLIGDRFAQETGIRLLPDPTLIEVAGTSVLISHGDILCTDDLDYQRARRILRHPLTKWVLNALPLTARQRIADSARDKSKAVTSKKTAAIMDVNTEAVKDMLRHCTVATLLHGHTHRPDEHALDLDGTPATRIVLSDWYSSGHVLRWDESGRHVSDLPF